MNQPTGRRTEPAIRRPLRPAARDRNGPRGSFTGWLLNSFRGYYQVGDRVAVGDVFGDVYRIDFLTTTVWEAGGADKPVQGAQPTGALVTFPDAARLVEETAYDVRYLVAVRERRLWSSRLLVALSTAVGAAEHAPKVRPAFPRRQVELLGGEERR